MTTKYLADKEIGPGVSLNLRTLDSRSNSSETQRFQLEMVENFPDHVTISKFPVNPEDYTEAQARRMYDAVNSVEDFHRLEKTNSS